MREMIFGKALSLTDFARKFGHPNLNFESSRLQSLTGATADVTSALLSAVVTGTQNGFQPMARSTADPQLANFTQANTNTAWSSMAAFFSQECGEEDCACDPDSGECSACPPDCGSGGSDGSSPVPGLAVVGNTWPPEIDSVTGEAQSFVDAVILNPNNLNITSGTLSATATLSPGDVSNTVTVSYQYHATAEAYTPNPPSQTTTYTASGSYTLGSYTTLPCCLLLTDIYGMPESAGPETWSVGQAQATWYPDTTPTISSVTLSGPLEAGSTIPVTINVVGLNFGVGATLQFSCAEDGTNGPSCSGADLPVVGSYLAQDSVHVTANITATLSAAGNYLVQVVSNGSTGFGFQAGGTGSSSNSAPKPGITVQPIATLQVTCNGQTVTTNSAICFISAQPTFPQIVASLVPQSGQTINGAVQWRIVCVYDSPVDPSTGTYYEYIWTPVASTQSSTWNVTRDVSALFGGTATISYTYGPSSGSITFRITADPSQLNPTVNTVQAALASYPWLQPQPWYLYQLVNQESSYHQFNLPGTNQYLPNWGAPQGFGLMMVDLKFWPIYYDDIIWDWTQNVKRGAGILQNEITDANTFWTQQLNAFLDYNNGVTTVNNIKPSPPAPPPGDVFEGGAPGGGCLFSVNLQEANSHSFSDAIAMKYYNAGEGTPYLQFVVSSPSSFDGHWALNQTGGNQTDYPALVCSKTQGN